MGCKVDVRRHEMAQKIRSGTIVFIDENLEDQKIGILSIPWPPAPQQIIARIREKHLLYDEMKWSTVSRVKVPFLTEIINIFFKNTSFGRITVAPIITTLDKAILQALQTIQPYSAPYHGIFIDDHTTPKGYDFERKLKTTFQCKCILRLDSKATQLLQLCDFFLNLVIRSDACGAPLSKHKAALVETFRNERSKTVSQRCFLL
jgi:hypothetical protein